MTPARAALIVKIASFGMLGFSLFMGLAPFSSINAPVIFAFDVMDWPLDGSPAAFDRHHQWFLAFSSSFLAGFSLLFIFVVCPALARGDERTRKVALYVLAVWFMMDNVGSIAAGVPVNALWNGLFILPFAIPLMTMQTYSD